MNKKVSSEKFVQDIDRLERFDPLTPEARNGLKSGLDKVLQGGLK